MQMLQQDFADIQARVDQIHISFIDDQRVFLITSLISDFNDVFRRMLVSRNTEVRIAILRLLGESWFPGTVGLQMEYAVSSLSDKFRAMESGHLSEALLYSKDSVFRRTGEMLAPPAGHRFYETEFKDLASVYRALRHEAYSD